MAAVWQELDQSLIWGRLFIEERNAAVWEAGHCRSPLSAEEQR